jgi:hypothetical protein
MPSQGSRTKPPPRTSKTDESFCFFFQKEAPSVLF